MTNTSAMRVWARGDNGESCGTVIFLAESMAHYSKLPNKADNVQKIFRVGKNRNFLLMGTELLPQVRRVVSELSQLELASLEETSKIILDITDKFRLSAFDYLNFTVAGPHETSIAVSHINTTGNYVDSGVREYAKRGFRFKDMVFDGISAEYLENYVNNMIHTGVYDISLLSDVFLLLYDLGRVGARVKGVDEKFQFGFISPEGISTLYHPDVLLMDEELVIHYNEMCGIDIPQDFRNFSNDKKKEYIQAIFDLHSILANFYFVLERDLSDFSDRKMLFTQVSQKIYKTPDADEHFSQYIRWVAEAMQNLDLGVDAFIRKGLANIKEYIDNYNQRQQKAHERALSLVSIRS